MRSPKQFGELEFGQRVEFLARVQPKANTLFELNEAKGEMGERAECANKKSARVSQAERESVLEQ